MIINESGNSILTWITSTISAINAASFHSILYFIGLLTYDLASIVWRLKATKKTLQNEDFNTKLRSSAAILRFQLHGKSCPETGGCSCWSRGNNDNCKICNYEHIFLYWIFIITVHILACWIQDYGISARNYRILGISGRNDSSDNRRRLHFGHA